MLFSLFTRGPLLDEDSTQWLFDAYAWALGHFDAGVFYDETILVLPSNEHFPGRVESVHGMANLIFERVKGYAGMAHWPTRLLEPGTCLAAEPARVRVQGALRGSGGVAPSPADPVLDIGYDAGQVGNPEALIASFAHTLAHYLGATASEPPPGGVENWPHVTEVLACFLGFGLMFANSAFNLRISACGSCGGPAADRQSYLSQYDMTYALAIFGVLKDIPDKVVQRHLKSSLRGFYRRCVRDVRGRADELRRLGNVGKPVALPA